MLGSFGAGISRIERYSRVLHTPANQRVTLSSAGAGFGIHGLNIAEDLNTGGVFRGANGRQAGRPLRPYRRSVVFNITGVLDRTALEGRMRMFL